MYITEKILKNIIKTYSVYALTDTIISNFAFQFRESDYMRTNFITDYNQDWILYWKKEKVAVIYIDKEDKEIVKIRRIFRPYHFSIAGLYDMRYYSPCNPANKKNKRDVNEFYQNIQISSLDGEIG